MTKVCLCGCFGKMGKEVLKQSDEFADLEIVAGIDRQCRKSENFPVFRSAREIGVSCDVILDFSSPTSLDDLIYFSQKRGIALAICTTGYSEEQMKMIKDCSDNIPIFLSGNTSLGINVLIKISKLVKKLLGKDFDVEIIEKHHNKKVDAPSGTALMIARSLADDNTNFVFERTSRRKARERDEIGIHSVRCGGIKGEHEVIFASEDEVLSIRHVAESRKIFAKGALEAAIFVSKMKNGLYSMEDLLDI